MDEVCSPKWLEVGSEADGALAECLSAVRSYEDEVDSQDNGEDSRCHIGEAAECLHRLANDLPPPGRALLDVTWAAYRLPSPLEFLPLLGALRRMAEWHAARISVFSSGTFTVSPGIVSFLQARTCELGDGVLCPADVARTVDVHMVWRGDVRVFNNEAPGSDVIFPGVKLKTLPRDSLSEALDPPGNSTAEKTPRRRNARGWRRNAVPEVRLYFGQSLDLVGLVDATTIPAHLISATRLELVAEDETGSAVRFLEKLSALKGTVGALFRLGCTITGTAAPPPSERSYSKWKELKAKKSDHSSVPNVKVKGESSSRFLFVQGGGQNGCRATLIRTADGINGAAAATIAQQLISTSHKLHCTGFDAMGFLGRLPVYRGDELVAVEMSVAHLQMLMLQEWNGRREKCGDGAEEAPKKADDDLVHVLRECRARCVERAERELPRGATALAHVARRPCPSLAQLVAARRRASTQLEIRALQNREAAESWAQGRSAERQPWAAAKGPVRGTRPSGPSGVLSARELLLLFNKDGTAAAGTTAATLPAPVRGGLSRWTEGLTVEKLSSMPFKELQHCRFHGLDYCLDSKRSLQVDRTLALLQSRCVRHETRSPCGLGGDIAYSVAATAASSPVPSPAPSPAPGAPEAGSSSSVLDGERLRKRSRGAAEPPGIGRSGRMLRSESGESLSSWSSLRYSASVESSSSGGGGGSKVAPVKCRPPGPSRDAPPTDGTPSLPRHTEQVHDEKQAQASEKGRRSLDSSSDGASKRPKESRLQKHNRMLLEVVSRAVEDHGIALGHPCYDACSKRLFQISKLYLKDLTTSRGLHEEMIKSAKNNVQQVVEWVLEKNAKK
ncbi:mdm2-binding protein [Lampetra fluviatilis]